MQWYKVIILLMLAVCCSCSSTKQLVTEAKVDVLQRRSGQLEDVLRSTGLQESWLLPVERNGVVVYDTIRHRIDMSDTIHHRVNVSDTIHSQGLSERTRGKVKLNQTGLRESIYSVGKDSGVSSVALVISIGINSILILVILSVYFLKYYHKA